MLFMKKLINNLEFCSTIKIECSVSSLMALHIIRYCQGVIHISVRISSLTKISIKQRYIAGPYSR